MNLIRSDRLATFVAVAEEASFTRASVRLRLSQPAVHAQVTELARDLGLVLYRRSGRGIALTDAGRRLLAHAREAEAREQDLLAALTGSDRAAPVILCAGEAITRYRLVPALRAFGERLRLVVSGTDASFEWLLDGRAQVAVVGAAPARDGLVRMPLLTVPQCLVVPHGHALALAGTATTADLQGRALIVPPPGRPHREALDRALVDWQVAVEVHGWDLMVQLVQAGLGLAIVNGIVPGPPDVVFLPLTDLPPIRYDVVVKEGPLRPAVAQLVTLLRETG